MLNDDKAHAPNGSEAEVCSQDPMYNRLRELELEHPLPKDVMPSHFALRRVMQNQTQGCTGDAQELSITIEPEGVHIFVKAGTVVVFGNNERIQKAIKEGSIVQGRQKDASHRWYIGIDDRTLDQEHFTVFTDSHQDWFVQNRETKHHTRIWDDTKATFKRLGDEQTMFLPTAIPQRFQLGARSKKGALSDHVIELQAIFDIHSHYI